MAKKKRLVVVVLYEPTGFYGATNGVSRPEQKRRLRGAIGPPLAEFAVGALGSGSIEKRLDKVTNALGLLLGDLAESGQLTSRQVMDAIGVSDYQQREYYRVVEKKGE